MIRHLRMATVMHMACGRWKEAVEDTNLNIDSGLLYGEQQYDWRTLVMAYDCSLEMHY